MRVVRSRRAQLCSLFLALLLATVALLATEGADAGHGTAFTRPLFIPPVLTGQNISLTAREADVQILNGEATRMWTYNGTFPGPTIRATSGQPTNVTLTNSLPAAGALSLHNHGNHSTPANDGQPDSFLIAPGQSKTYAYTGTENGGGERGATQWYHDHRMDVTGRNVWMGLAGFYLIDDPADPVSLPKGEFDVPLMLADRSFNASNQLSYSFDATGLTGDHALVNGVPQPYFEVAARRYRLRILNASNLRDYELELSNGQPLLQIGTDAGLLPAPVSRQQILIGPAERVDVVVDFAGKLGQDVVLRNAAGKGATGDLLQFRVRGVVTDDSSVPARLRPLESLGEPIATRTFEFARTNGKWTINGLGFDPNRVDASPVLGTTEKWVLRNPGGWSHIVHIHDVDQQLLARNGGAAAPWELTKEAWHIGGGQTVEVKLRFTDNVGRYVIHCHVLEHEDMAMMAQFEVVAPPAGTHATAPRGPTAGAPATGGDGNGFEQTPSGAFADAGVSAGNIDGAGDRHVFSGYGLGSVVPSGATVTGIEVRLDWWLDKTRGVNALGVELSSDGGANWTSAKTEGVEATRERTGVLGGANDTWGRTWTTADLADPGFRVRVTSQSDIATRDFFLDWVPVTIHYR